MNFFKRLKDPEQKQLLKQASKSLSKESAQALEYALKEKIASLKTIEESVAGTHISIIQAQGDIAEDINQALRQHAYKQAFEEFSGKALESISATIAPNIYNLDSIKKAVTLQLAAKQGIHVLLLGDPGTGKTDIIRAAAELIEPSIFGLGSGTSNAGLSLAYTKGKLHEGLLVQADGGLCCIDELNLMKKTDRAALYNAMEKGFVTYSKAGKDAKASANVKILATANPKGDTFESEKLEDIKKQLPFEEALLSRFHIVFIIHRPDEETFTKIAEQVVREKKTDIDNRFIKSYLKDCKQFKPKLSKKHEQQIVAAASNIRAQEEKIFMDVSPRMIKGLKELTLASARLHRRNKVTEQDIKNSVNAVNESLGI